MPSIEVTTAPVFASTLHTLLSALRYELREPPSSETPHLLTYLEDAYAEVEDTLRRAIFTQTLTAQFDARESYSPVWLPRAPVQSITSVTTYDIDDEATVVASSNYRLEGETGASGYVDAARLVAVNSGWTVERGTAALKVVYVAGYGGKDELPDWARRAIVRKASAFWRFRTDVISGTTTNAAPVTTADDLLWPHIYAR